MKVYLVWYIDPYNSDDGVLKIFLSESKANDFINSTKEYEKEDLTIQEMEVE